LDWRFYWGVGGVVLMLVDAILRLSPVAARAFTHDLGVGELAALVALCAGMAWVEGFKGFHQRFAPRTIKRAALLRGAPPLAGWLAPLTAMGMLYATRRRLMGSWGLVVGILVLIVGLRFAPPLWRSMVDAGVCTGLSIGVVSLLVHAGRALRGTLPTLDADFPEASS